MKNFTEIGRKIVAVGRNYKAHAAELGNVVPEKPLLFLKPTSAYIQEGERIRNPGSNNLQHEVELGIVIGKKFRNVTKANASEMIAGYVLALDMTARDFQDQERKAGNSWFLGKCFDTACPVSRFIAAEEIHDPQAVELWCKYASRIVTFMPGDVLLTGTPEGVSRVQSGDVIECGITGVVTMKFEVE